MFFCVLNELWKGLAKGARLHMALCPINSGKVAKFFLLVPCRLAPVISGAAQANLIATAYGNRCSGADRTYLAMKSIHLLKLCPGT